MSTMGKARGAAWIGGCVWIVGCGGGDAPTSPLSSAEGEAFVAARPADRCVNVFESGTGPLGLIEVAPGVFTVGALPFPFQVGEISGSMSSIVTSLEASGSAGQGAQHLTLQHTFTSAEGSFQTQDVAVCAPAGVDPNVCRVNDVLRIVSGDGAFTGAEGMLHNRGVIDLNTFTLSFTFRGRVCGDGL